MDLYGKYCWQWHIGYYNSAFSSGVYAINNAGGIGVWGISMVSAGGAGVKGIK
jgi:hypothetical protein